MVAAWPFPEFGGQQGSPVRGSDPEPRPAVPLYSETLWPQFQDVSGAEEQPMTEALNQEVSPLPCLPLSSL